MPKNKNEIIVSVQNLSKSFSGVQVLENVDLDIYEGEVFGFLGPNGAGKTTTIRAILNVLHPDHGKIFVFGIPSKKTKQIHKRIGYLSGDMALEDDITGGRYLRFVNHIYGGEYGSRISELARLFEVDLSEKIGNYSRGNKQRIGLMAAILHKPELLILDEPTSGFDPIMQSIFSKIILDFKKRGGTVLMSSHILSEVQELCDRVAFIKEGSIVGVKDLNGLYDKLTKRITVSSDSSSVKQLESQADRLTGLSLLKKNRTKLTFSYNGDIKKLLKFFAAQNIKDIMIEEPDLEEIFLDFYKAKTRDRND
jgi:ABC-2 type transport system ATP-binding protein